LEQFARTQLKYDVSTTVHKKRLDNIHHKLATYSILINGKPHDNITPSRDLRQGNPLYPYLFLLCTKGLHGLIQKTANTATSREFLFVAMDPN